jgi:hypothetical protein
VGCWVSDFSLKIRVKSSLTFSKIKKNKLQKKIKTICLLHLHLCMRACYQRFYTVFFDSYLCCKKTWCSNCHFTKKSSTIEAFNWRDHKRRNPIMFLHFIQSMLLAYQIYEQWPHKNCSGMTFLWLTQEISKFQQI